MSRRLLSTVATGALLLGLAACGDPNPGAVTTPPPDLGIDAPNDGGGESSDGGGENPSSDGDGAPTADAPDIPPPDPADYAGMDQNTPEGAEQAFRYYIAVSIWAHQTGDTEELDLLSGNGCHACNTIVTEIESLSSTSQTWSPTDLKAYGSEIYDSKNYDHEIGYIYIVGPHSEHSESGDVESIEEQAYTAIGGLVWNVDHWIVDGLSIDETQSEL